MNTQKMSSVIAIILFPDWEYEINNPGLWTHEKYITPTTTTVEHKSSDCEGSKQTHRHGGEHMWYQAALDSLTPRNGATSFERWIQTCRNLAPVRPAYTQWQLCIKLRSDGSLTPLSLSTYHWKDVSVCYWPISWEVLPYLLITVISGLPRLQCCNALIVGIVCESSAAETDPKTL